MAFVYRFKHKITGEVIYVGETNRTMKARMNEHFKGHGHLPSKCYKCVGRVEYIPLNTQADAKLHEYYFINKYKPIYNKKDKFDSPLTVNVNIKENWKLYAIINKEGFYISFKRIFDYIKMMNINIKNIINTIINSIKFILDNILSFISKGIVLFLILISIKGIFAMYFF